MAVAMVAMLAFGGTYAYFTSEAGKVAEGTATAGKIALVTTGSTATATATVAVLPGESVFASPMAIKIDDQSTRASFIFLDVTITVTTAGGSAAELDSDLFTLTGLESLASATQIAGIAEAGRTVYAIETQEQLSGNAYTVTGGDLDLSVNIALNAEKVGNTYQEATFSVVVNVNSIQAEGFEGDAEAAWTAFSATKGNNGVKA